MLIWLVSSSLILARDFSSDVGGSNSGGWLHADNPGLLGLHHPDASGGRRSVRSLGCSTPIGWPSSLVMSRCPKGG